MNNQLLSPPGKTKAIGIVYDKDGRIKVDNWDTLCPELKKRIEQELENGRELSNNVRP